MAQQPSTLPTWTSGPSANCVVPPQSLLASGWTAGQRPPVEYVNWLQWSVGAWLQYLLTQSGNLQQTAALDPSVRLMGGGQWSWNATTGTLAWSDTLYIGCASVDDAVNAIPAGSISLGGSGGDLAYVQCNIPFAALGSISNGGVTLTLTQNAGSVAKGMSVSGPGVPRGTIVAGFDGDGNPQLSQAATADESAQTYVFVSTGQVTVQTAANSAFVPSIPTVVIARFYKNMVYLGANSGQMVLRDGESKYLLASGYVSTLTAPAGVALTAGQAVYLSSAADGRTTGALYPADVSSANGALRGQFIGFVTTAVAAGSNAHVCTSGTAPLFSGLTAGTVYFLDPATPGAITTTQPTAVGQYVVPVGFALSATTLRLNPTATQALTAIQNGLTVNGPLTVNGAQVIKSGASGSALQVYEGTGKTVVGSLDTSGNLTAAGALSTASASVSGALSAGASTLGSLTGPNGLLGVIGSLTGVTSISSGTLSLSGGLGVGGTLPSGPNAIVSGYVQAGSLRSVAGIKRQVFMGGYASSSFPGGNQNLVTTHSGSDYPRRAAQPYAGSVLAISVSFASAMSATTNVLLLKNGNNLVSANLTLASNGLAAYATFAKGTYAFVAGDVLSATINFSSSGINVIAQCDLTVESDA